MYIYFIDIVIQVIMKSDGYLIYYFVNVVDDYLMEIIYVLRGQVRLYCYSVSLYIYC